MNVCHITSVHSPNDVRIFYRECVSLVKRGYKVTLVAPGADDYEQEGVSVKTITKYEGRFRRMLLGPIAVFNKARKQKADVYHFHDPELILIGFLLKLMGNKVVFDVHENVYKQILNKEWLRMRKLISVIYRCLDILAAKSFYLLLAEMSYLPQYEKYTKRVNTLLNMPDLSFFEKFVVSERSELKNELFYIGRVSEHRGVFVVLDALVELDKRGVDYFFHCIGPQDHGVMDRITSNANYENVLKKVKFYGPMDLAEGYAISTQCKIGLSVLMPIDNYVESYSTKIFEYMAIGLPVITSNFKLYQDVVEVHDTGICVDPHDHLNVANAIEKVLKDTVFAAQIAKNGRSAAQKTYNWNNEVDKLEEAYRV